jgi:NADH-quinone oxidoreductase subunit L
MFVIVPLIVLFPALGLLTNLVFGRRRGERFAGWVACAAIALSFGVAVLQFLAVRAFPEGARVPIADWIQFGDLAIPWAMKVDTLSVTMMLMVTGVSLLIHIYAVGYMHEDVRFKGDPGRYPRFFIFFNLFVLAMLVLVSADNFVMFFVGWEGVGLCSYLLIGFWYDKGKDGIGNAVAGKKAMVANRIGDAGFLLAMFLTFATFRSLQFDTVFARAQAAGPAATGVLTVITLFLLVGATGKSAQIPLFVWLPDAMAGPTPVSALIHAATMVTAGVYMIARNHVLFSLAPTSSHVVAFVGACTALFAATIAVGQFDIKKVLAYSTISQLGFMVAAVGLGAYVAGMFHLLTHAFFKALLFLSAGSVIQGIEHGEHAVAHAGPTSIYGPPEHEAQEAFDPQDMRNMGGLRTRMRTTFWVYLIGTLAIAGIPPLAGFFSKDEILADASAANTAVYILLIAAAFLTAFYMGRQVLMVFFGKSRSEAAAHARENPAVMTGPLVGLAILAVIGGGLNLPGVNTLTGWLGHTLGEIHSEPFNPVVAGVSTGLALTSLALAWALYGRRPLAASDQPDPLRRLLGPVFVGMNNKWWVDELYAAVIIRPFVAFSRLLSRGETEAGEGAPARDVVHDQVLVGGYQRLSEALAVSVDLGFVDALANDLAIWTKSGAGRLRRAQTGFVRNYMLLVFLGAVLIVGYLILRTRGL